jgi:SAM-dependent MidA family methyltransferase
MLQAFESLGVLPGKYFLLEVSADLRERQQALLSTLPAHLYSRVEWLDRLPAHFDGAMVANEVLDVVPVHLLHFHSGGISERGVAVKDGEFCWKDVPVRLPDLAASIENIRESFPSGIPEGYLTEVAPAVDGLITSLSASLRNGVMLLIDYGFRRAEYYHPDRVSGTLMCHYRQYAHTDPFRFPGLQDITAHVDFTRVAETGLSQGLELVGYTTQAQYLLQSGITDLLAGQDVNNTADYLPLTNQVQRLLSPAEMGEFFKVIGFSRGVASIDALAMARPLPI